MPSCRAGHRTLLLSSLLIYLCKVQGVINRFISGFFSLPPLVPSSFCSTSFPALRVWAGPHVLCSPGFKKSWIRGWGAASGQSTGLARMHRPPGLPAELWPPLRYPACTLGLLLPVPRSRVQCEMTPNWEGACCSLSLTGGVRAASPSPCFLFHRVSIFRFMTG